MYMQGDARPGERNQHHQVPRDQPLVNRKCSCVTSTEVQILTCVTSTKVKILTCVTSAKVQILALMRGWLAACALRQARRARATNLQILTRVASTKVQILTLMRLAGCMRIATSSTSSRS